MAAFSGGRRSHKLTGGISGSAALFAFSASLWRQASPASIDLKASAGMLDIFGQQIIHGIAYAVAKVVTDLAHTVKSGDQVCR